MRKVCDKFILFQILYQEHQALPECVVGLD